MKQSKLEHAVAKKIGAAIGKYNMISSGDKVLVGASGGKDSLTLLKVLIERKKWLPIDYKVKAVHVITDYDKRPKVRKDALKRYFDSLGCEYIFKEAAIAKKNKLKKEDCFWCAWNRRREIFEAAGEAGFNKVALGHHKDDIAETVLMNMIFNGEISSINPVQPLFGGKVTIIRPMVFLEEEEIRRYALEASIPLIKSDCPKNVTSKRAVIKDIIAKLASENPGIKSNILNAPTKIKADYITEINA